MKNHVGGKPEETMKQRLWPVHCVQGTSGSDIIDEIDMSKVDLVIQKGMDARVEMYSAFSDSFGNLTAGQGGVSHDLESIFKEKGITHVYVVGLAGDYCVKVSLHFLQECGDYFVRWCSKIIPRTPSVSKLAYAACRRVAINPFPLVRDISRAHAYMPCSGDSSERINGGVRVLCH
jgi:hypothetical protein